MNHDAVPRCAALVAAALLAACASSADMEARYAQSLQQWKGAPADRLVATWGKPRLEETLPDGTKALTYVVRYDDLGSDRMSATTVVAAPAGGGPLGTRATTAGMLTSAAVPITCTTRFVLQDGLVTSWTFKGLGCGAPKQ